MPLSRMIACARAIRFSRSSTPIGGTSPRIDFIAASSFSAVDPPTPMVIVLFLLFLDYLAVIASERSNPEATALGSGLLRRFAPRNDETGYPMVLVQAVLVKLPAFRS